MNDGKRQVTDETEPDENLIATIHYENGTELTGKAVTLQDGTVGVRIPNEFFKTALLPDGSMPDGVLSVDIGPKHVPTAVAGNPCLCPNAPTGANNAAWSWTVISTPH